MRLTANFIITVSCLGILGNVNAQYNFNVKRTFGETNHQIVYASYNSDGKYIITAGSDSSIIIWNADRRTIYRTLTGLKARPNVAIFSVDNKFALSGGKDNIVSMWDLATMPSKIVKTFEGHKGPIKSLDVSPNGKYLATGSTDGTIRIWDLLNTNLVYELKGHNKDVNSITFSPDGKTLVSGGADGVINLWNIENGSRIISQPGHKGWIRDIAFSPNGSKLYSCGDDKLINEWQVPSLTKSGTLKGHKDWVQTIDLSPDGKTLISGGRDKLIILWDVDTQKILLQSDKQEQIIISVDMNPVRSDFISSCFESVKVEIWALSGLDETQWEKNEEIITSSMVSDNIFPDNQQKVSQEQSINIITPTQKPPQNNSMIEIFSPVAIEGRIVHDKNSILVIGRVSDPQGINTFLINNNVIKLSEVGVFQSNLYLTKGENLIDMVAINNKGILNQLKLVVICTASDAMVQEQGLPEISKGKYFALLIGINEYQHDEIADLENPISDAESLYDVLLSRYSFDKDNIIFLKNPSQDELIMSLDELGRKLTNNDNLLIFYAGHGYWDDKGKVGFWLPSDASKNSTVNWFRNSTLRDFIGSIQTRHTLLIADACFSGAIFKTRAAFSDSPKGVQKLYELPSRKAMTSGILQEVPDKSVFLEYLIKRLKENQEHYLPSEILFSSFKSAVMNNSNNVPQYGIIQNVGDEGGDFIFIRR